MSNKHKKSSNSSINLKNGIKVVRNNQKKTSAPKFDGVSKLALPRIIGGDFDYDANDISKYQKMIDDAPKRNEKPRILFIGEASYLKTGFSTYLHYVFSHLYETGKYELAEHASYGYSKNVDPRARSVKWKYYHCMPESPEEERLYKSDHEAQFGKLKLSQTLSDFRPDIIICIRDNWMDTHVLKNKLAKNASIFWMVCLDGSPQKWEWLQDYNNVDKVFAYSYFGKKVLESQSKSELAKVKNVKPILVSDVMQAGADLDVLKPLPRDEVYEKLGLGEAKHLRFIGTVMRNQPRKLFTRIIESFAELIRKHPKESENVMLHLHTSVRDVGFNIPEAIQQNGVEHRVTFTYLCQGCGNVAISTFRGSPTQCPLCGENKMDCPSTAHGLDPKTFNLIYNMLDVYIQGSIAEGCFGKGTLVCTGKGYIPIETVSVGDKILSHNGKWQTVNKTFINEVSSSVLKLGITGTYEDIMITDNHKVYVAKTNEVIDKWGRKHNTPIGEVTSKSAGKLTKEDWIACPIDQHVDDVQYIKITDYVSDSYEDKNGLVRYKTKRYCKSGIQTDVKNKFELNNDNLSLLGLLMGDGYFDGRYVSISGNSQTKLKNFELFEKSMNGLTENPVGKRIKSNANATECTVSSPILSKFFRALIGRYSRDRKIPSELIHLPINKQKLFICGYYMADNTTDKDLIGFSTSSLQLATQVRNMLSRMNICMYISSCKRSSCEYKIYTKINRVELSLLVNETNFKYEKPKKDRLRSKIINNYIFSRVKKIEKCNYDCDKVYNLQAIDRENINNTVSSFAVSCATAGMGNCGMPINEAKACGVPVLVSDYSAMYEKGRMPGGQVIENDTIYTECETMQHRSLFNRKDLVKKLKKLLTNEKYRKKMATDARKCAEDYYDWKLTAKKWEAYIDTAEFKDRKKTWDQEDLEIREPSNSSPDSSLNDKDFIVWLYDNVLCRKNGPDPEGLQYWMTQLSNGADRSVIEQHFRKIIQDENHQKKLMAKSSKELSQNPVDRIKAQIEKHEGGNE